MEYIEKMDTIISSIKSNCDSSIILTRDTNIDLLSRPTDRDMYEPLLETYQLSYHVIKRTLNDKTVDR